MTERCDYGPYKPLDGDWTGYFIRGDYALGIFHRYLLTAAEALEGKEIAASQEARNAIAAELRKHAESILGCYEHG